MANKYRADLKKPDFGLKVAAAQYKEIDDSRPYLTDNNTIRELSKENNAKANQRSLAENN
jgi:NADH-quinone oxidoreductase subunit G